MAHARRDDADGGMIDRLLRNVKRRYRLPPLPPLTDGAVMHGGHPATTLSLAIEHARRASAEGRQPKPEAKALFVSALDALIREAMDAEAGDAAIQAMVLRHHDPVLREYASLFAHARADRRRVLHWVNAVAHPAKLERSDSKQVGLLAQVHALATTEAWTQLVDTLASAQNDDLLPEPLARVLESPALHRLRRRDALSELESVRRYQTLRAQMGPEARSEDAMADGLASHQRGAAVEAAAAKVMEGLAGWLNGRMGSELPRYRVVTSMRAPATLPADHHYAKTEWDVVLLERVMAPPTANGHRASAEQSTTVGSGASSSADRGADRSEADVWKVALLLEAKASVDAAAIDLPRLIRGLHLMAQADENEVYVFQSRQGGVPLHGASLRLLADDETGLNAAVLYCSNGADQTPPRLLSAASRMQLLSAPASLEYAASLGIATSDSDEVALPGTAEGTGAYSVAENQVSTEQAVRLESVWHDLLTVPRWQAVLIQYLTLCRALELMVHVTDLERAVSELERGD